MTGPKNRHHGVVQQAVQREIGGPLKKKLSVSSWFTGEDAEHVARRIEVWTLLEWYHHRYVIPNMGLRGFLRRLYCRMRGHKIDGVNLELVALLSPWEEYKVKAAIRAAMKELERCPIAFVFSDGEDPAGPRDPDDREPRQCELERDHDGQHHAGALTWSDDD